MKTQSQNPKRGWVRALSCLLAFALVCCTVLAAPPLDGAALAEPTGDPLELTHSILTVQLPTDTDEADAAALTADDTGAVVDYYHVADAVKVDGYDTYAYRIDSSSLYYNAIYDFLYDKEGTAVRDGWQVTRETGKLTFHATLDLSVDAQQTDFRELAQNLTEALVAELADPDVSIEPAGRAKLNDKAEFENTAGLYLALVRGGHAEHMDVGRYVARADADNRYVDENRYVTVAYGPNHVYGFAPMLISAPGRQLAPGQQGGDPTYTTDTTQGQWINDVTVVAKPDISPRYASLELVKSLPRYSQAATFVFRVTAWDENNNAVFEKVVPFTFSEAGDKSVKLDNCIPAGSTVEIKEEYTGAVYSYSSLTASTAPLNGENTPNYPQVAVTHRNNAECLVSAIPGGLVMLNSYTGQPVTITDGGRVTVTFTNDTNNSGNNGGSVVNHYSKDASGNWTWKQLTPDGESDNGTYNPNAAKPDRPN